MIRRGFTLLEMLVAVSLGTVLVLTITATFRAISRTVAAVNALGRENELLRAGYFVAIEDADFFHSEANPDLPYSKGWTRVQPVNATPADKRHFARVAFRAGTAPADPYDILAGLTPPRALRTAVTAGLTLPVLPNPNVMMPSDPRSWMRVGTVANTTNTGSDYISPQQQCIWFNPGPVFASDFSIRNALTSQVYGDARLASATDMFDPVLFPSGSGVGDGSGAVALVDPRVNQTLPCLQAALWHQLSYVGIYHYLRPAAPVNCLDSRGFLPSWRTPVAGWATRTDTPRGLATPSSPLPPLWSSGDREQYFDYLAAGNAQHNIFIGMHLTWEAQTGLFVKSTVKSLQVKPVYPNDVGVNLVSYYLSGSDSTYFRTMNQAPWAGNDYNFQQFLNSKVDVARSPSFTSTTWRFPANPTDGERPSVTIAGVAIPATRIVLDGRPLQYPVMSTAIQRHHALLGDQVTFCRVIVRVPETGRSLELAFTPVCTTLRGARQHWARVPSGIVGMPPAGDVYVP